MNCSRSYNLGINDRAFNAIKELRQKIEIRATKLNGSFDYGIIKADNTINFMNSLGEKLECKVVKINWYKSIENLLAFEGTKYVFSSTDDFDEVVKSINNIPDYKEAIEKNGVYAIHIELIKGQL